MLQDIVARADGLSEDRQDALAGRGTAPDWNAVSRRFVDASEAEVKRLAQRITEEAAVQLRLYGSDLSEAHLRGLHEPAEFIARMAFGVAPPVMALSSMSTGMGKSELVAATGRVLTSDPAYADIGLVVFTNTRLELPTMAERMNFSLRTYDPRFAVFTGKRNAALNALGRGADDRDAAQVLFTTQSKFLWWHRFMPFRRKDFHYRGTPRQIRLWDETALPIDPMTLTPDQLENFAAELFTRGLYQIAQQIREWSRQLRGLPHDSVVRVPPFTEELRVAPLLPCDETGRLPKDEDEETVFSEICAALAYLAGKEVRIYRDVHTGAAISYREILPDSITPLLVLDANADKRTAYKLVEEARGGLLHLYSPRRTYRGFTVKHRNIPAGRRQHQKTETRAPLVEAAVEAFFEAQAEGPTKVLLIHYKPNSRKRLPNMLRIVKREVKKRGGDPSLLVGIHWGMEKATNRFRDVRAVIALGVQQAPLYEIVAEVRGLLKLTQKADVDPATVEAHRRAQQMTTLFQGVGRSAIRLITGSGDVPPVTLWLIASAGKGRGKMPFPIELMPEWFPELPAVQRWGGPDVRGGQRPAFLEALKARAGGPPFGYADFPGFTRKVASNYLNDGSMKEGLDMAGLQLEPVAAIKPSAYATGAPVKQYRVVRLMSQPIHPITIGSGHEGLGQPGARYEPNESSDGQRLQGPR